ncbi:MAG: PAS domain-containing sensor histidine kinase [Rickettsiales bacterium]|nr:PAS domain-containing sensor histidine kinase [Rickettsiales bacterium]
MVWWMWTAPFASAMMNPVFQDAEAHTEQPKENTNGQHYDALAEHGLQACCNWRPDDGFYHFSSNWIRVTGVSAPDSKGTHFYEHFHPDSQAEFEQGIKTLFHPDPQEITDSYSFDAQIMRGDGYWAWHHLTLIPMRRGANSFVSVLLQDVTERKSMQQDVELAKRESDIANYGRSSFLSNMSHELRTPLNAIMGFAQLLDQQSRQGHVQQSNDYLKLIQQSGEELLTKINDLIEIANIDATSARLYEEPINLREIIDAAMEMHSHLAFEKDISLLLDNRVPQLVLMADRTKCIHILSHLISNAIKHSQSSGQVIITAKADTKDGITISVKDSGIGITNKHLEEIKDALRSRQCYYRTDISSVRLGLSIAKEFAELHDGQIDIQSAPDQGTCASLHIPSGRIVSLSAKVKPKIASLA